MYILYFTFTRTPAMPAKQVLFVVGVCLSVWLSVRAKTRKILTRNWCSYIKLYLMLNLSKYLSFIKIDLSYHTGKVGVKVGGKGSYFCRTSGLQSQHRAGLCSLNT